MDQIIDFLFTEIETSVPSASNPGKYIEASPLPYRELLYCGDYTLRYIFSRFLEGNQTDLRGQLMRIVLDDLAPEAVLRLYAETGQEYFDAWQAGAQRMRDQHGEAWMEQNQPAAWMMLQMMRE